MTDNKQFFPQTLPNNTSKLVGDLHQKQPDFLKDFYLSGGTALSLQVGHRESEDLDFFSQDSFNPQKLQQQLSQLGKLKNIELADGTVNTFLDGVKLRFLEYPYKLIKPTVIWQSIQLSSMEDIACTKLQTIGIRGSKKDFIDLYFLLSQYSLEDLFKLMQKKYQDINYSKTHILKSLVYFEDAKEQPLPRMHQAVSWDEVKKKMIEAVREIKVET